jgi:transposase-like protein
MQYSETFKAQIVQKLTRPGGPSANALSGEVGVHQSTLSRWLREAHVPWQVSSSPAPDEPGTTMPARRPQDWTAEEKYAVLIEAASLPDEELGAFLREKGLHQANLKQWRQAMLTALGESKARSSKPTAETRRIRELERELARKEKALAEAAALLLLKKKAQALWGDEDDITAKKRGRRS